MDYNRTRIPRFSVARLLAISGAVLYAVALDWFYRDYVSDIYGYMSHWYKKPQTYMWVLSLLFSVIPAFLLPTKSERPSNVVYWLLFVLVYVPSCILPPSVGLIAHHSLLISYQIALLIAFMGGQAFYLLPCPLIPVRSNKANYWALIIAMSLVLYVIIIATCGFRLKFHELDDVYDVRSEYRDSLARGGRFAAYAIGWQSNSINVLLICHGLISRSTKAFVAGLVGQLFIFSITGYKSVYFSGLLIIAIWSGWRIAKERVGSLMPWCMTVMIGLSVFLYTEYNNLHVLSLTRRNIVTTGLLSTYYLDFFSEHPTTMLSDSIFHPFLTYPYSLPIANLIADQYLGHHRCSANASLFTYGYASFGLGGMVFFGVALGGVLWLFDGLAKNRNRLLAMLMLTVPAFAFANSSLMTTLLTHGLVLSLVLLWGYPTVADGQSVAA